MLNDEKVSPIVPFSSSHNNRGYTITEIKCSAWLLMNAFLNVAQKSKYGNFLTFTFDIEQTLQHIKRCYTLRSLKHLYCVLIFITKDKIFVKSIPRTLLLNDNSKYNYVNLSHESTINLTQQSKINFQLYMSGHFLNSKKNNTSYTLQ